jgi:hypothetical protein
MIPKFIYTDLSKYNFSGMTGNDITNLNNYVVGSKFVGTSLDDVQYLIIDTGNTYAKDVLIIDNHNFMQVLSSGSIQFETSTDAGFSTSSTIVSDLVLPDVPIYKEIDSTTNRYFRIAFSGSFLQGAYIGNIFIDKVRELNLPIVTNWKVNNYKYSTNEFNTISGVSRNSQLTDGKVCHEFGFKLINDANKQTFINIVTAIKGRALPLYIVLENIVSYVNMKSDYTPVTVNKINLNDIVGLKFEGNNTRVATVFENINADCIYEDEIII